MIILCPLSKVTTSATQLGAHEWLIYLQDKSENWTRQQWEEHSPLKETNDISIDVLTKEVWRFQSTAQPEWGHFYASKVFWTNGSPASPCRPSCECSINHVVIVHAEHVHTSVLKRRQAIIIVIWSSFTSTHSLCWPDSWSFLGNLPNTADALLEGQCEHQMGFCKAGVLVYIWASNTNSKRWWWREETRVM